MRITIALSAVGVLVGVALSYRFGEELVGITMLLALVVLPLGGVLVTIDDDLPGGFPNPNGAVPGPWRHWENWANLGARCAITGIGFAIDGGWRTVGALELWMLGAAGFVASALIHKRLDRQVVENGG